jgi:hypothetical protein
MLPLSRELVAVDAVVFDRLTVDARVRRLATEPPNMSLIDGGDLALNRFREMASRPKIPALDRMVLLGVAGAESLPVLNLNRPY